MRKTDVAIIGGGPGGSCAAMFLGQLGVRSVIVERERFPRYHIGESFTGETGGQLRKLGMEQELNSRRYPVKVGTTVVGAGGKNSFYVEVRDRLGPGGTQRPASTWQARRSEFDTLLLNTAMARGTEVLPGEAISVLQDGDRVTGVRWQAEDGTTEDVVADVTIDASGQGTFFANRGITSPKERGNYDRQIAIFSQVVGAIRDEGPTQDNTLIFYREKHHWAWFIPLDHEAVSVGVVVPSEYFTGRKLSKEAFLREELSTINPDLAWRLEDVRFVEDTRATSNYSYYVERFTGNGWLCVGDSHRFIDPIFSFGLLFATREAQYAAESIRDHLDGKRRDADHPFADYEAFADRGQDIIQSLVDCFWEFPLPFQRFAHKTHPEQIVDLFAGRIYGSEVHENESIVRMRRLLDAKGIRRSTGIPVEATATS